MIQTELTRFKVKTGKTATVDEWMTFLNDHMKETLLTLENEKMFIETVFREQLDGIEYLYWYSVQRNGGNRVENSENWIDKKHLEYWDECIDSSYKPIDLTAEVVMIPDKIRINMN
ncbi:DUF6176 family protein [Candidatus Enterococcus avicola]